MHSAERGSEAQHGLHGLYIGFADTAHTTTNRRVRVCNTCTHTCTLADDHALAHEHMSARAHNRGSPFPCTIVHQRRRTHGAGAHTTHLRRRASTRSCQRRPNTCAQPRAAASCWSDWAAAPAAANSDSYSGRHSASCTSVRQYVICRTENAVEKSTVRRYVLVMGSAAGVGPTQSGQVLRQGQAQARAQPGARQGRCC
mgnify:CR=1 FL=1